MKLNIKTTMLAALVAAGSYADPIQLSVTGTAQTTEMGYTTGQGYTFNWVLTDGYTGGSGDSFSTTYDRWHADTTSDPVLWTSVSGDGLSGTYSRPSGSANAPFEWLSSYSSGLEVIANNDNTLGSSMGLTVNGVEVSSVHVWGINIPGRVLSDSFVNPAAHLATVVGTYALSSGTMRVRDESSNSIIFTPTSATITAIPEPGTLAFVGLFGGGLWFVRRYFPSV